MASTLEKTHMCLTKDDVKWLNGDQNVSNSKQYEPNKPSESNLQLKHPLGFLGFLDKISRHKVRNMNQMNHLFGTNFKLVSIS